MQVGQWTGPTPGAIDHNGYVRGNRYYMSNYTRGFNHFRHYRSNTSLSEVGFFDTYPPSDNASFNGAWGVYPFLPSGTILVSDINSGLYISCVITPKHSDTLVRFSFRQHDDISTAQGTTLSLLAVKQRWCQI